MSEETQALVREVCGEVEQPQPIHKGVAGTMIPQCGADVSEGCIMTDMDDWVTCERCLAMCSR